MLLKNKKNSKFTADNISAVSYIFVGSFPTNKNKQTDGGENL